MFQKKLENSWEIKKIVTNICRIQAYDSKICGYFCLGFIVFRLKGKCLLEYTNLISPNDYKKNDKIIKEIFFVNRF